MLDGSVHTAGEPHPRAVARLATGVQLMGTRRTCSACEEHGGRLRGAEGTDGESTLEENMIVTPQRRLRQAQGPRPPKWVSPRIELTAIRQTPAIQTPVRRRLAAGAETNTPHPSLLHSSPPSSASSLYTTFSAESATSTQPSWDGNQRRCP